jgi:hypothetical protein
MSGFLEGYGVEDVRRARVLKWILVSVLLVIVIGTAAYFGLRAYPAKRRVNLFIQDLRKGDYQSAYQLWGCTADSPCREYTFEKFMEDWGPTSTHANPGRAEIETTRYCGPGVIVAVRFGQEDVSLWYERRNGTLGFAPWPVCAPQPKAYQ